MGKASSSTLEALDPLLFGPSGQMASTLMSPVSLFLLQCGGVRLSRERSHSLGSLGMSLRLVACNMAP